MGQRLKLWIEEAGADWMVNAEIDEVRIYEESHLDEWSARADAEDFERKLLGDLCGDERERNARICERLAKMMEDGAGEDRPGHRLRQAARLIRESGA